MEFLKADLQFFKREFDQEEVIVNVVIPALLLWYPTLGQ